MSQGHSVDLSHAARVKAAVSKSLDTAAEIADELESVKAGLEEYERNGDNKPPFILTHIELKLLGIAGVGFFLDAYDLFIINPVATMLQFRLYGGNSLPTGLEGFMKAGANIGSVIGQFLFGYLADSIGRKAVYGKELIIIIISTILCISVPTGSLTPSGSLIYLAVFRILLGVGVGGDYPMSASITTDRVSVRRRGAMLAYIFSNQGWGSLAGSIVVLVVLACYKHVMDTDGETSKVDGVWRIVVGLSLIPAFGTLYQRLTLPESRRYQATRQLHEGVPLESIPKLPHLSQVSHRRSGSITTPVINSAQLSATPTIVVEKNTSSTPDEKDSGAAVPGSPNLNGATSKDAILDDTPSGRKPKAHFREFISYFSEWRHAKILIGTCVCWFLLDIAFYGINLNQNVVLQQIGFDGKHGTPWHRLFKISIGNLIVTSLGFVPGYYATIFSVEYLGRKWIQIQGFLLAALFLGILAGQFHELSKPAFIVCFALLQFFFNFGANSTTYLYPAEVFPTRFRASAHGFSAACGKAGAIISALAFNNLSKKIGTPATLWIFVGCCIFGAFFSLLLPEVKGRDPDAIYAEELREDQLRKM